MKPQMQLKKVIVVSHDLRAEALIAMMPVMTQCQIQSCKHTHPHNTQLAPFPQVSVSCQIFVRILANH
jgi:hypothetical protein